MNLILFLGERVIFANIPDINVPANLLKMFLKCLPESLIPISLTDMLAALLEIPDESEKLKYLAWMLENYVPDPNYATLKYIGMWAHLFSFYSLHKLTSYSFSSPGSRISLQRGYLLSVQ